MSAMRQPAIVHSTFSPKKKKSLFIELETRLLKSLDGGSIINQKEKKDKEKKREDKKEKEKTQVFNLLEAERDFENCNGWSVTAQTKDLETFKGPKIGVFMVNLFKGSMVEPHWNPNAMEIAVALQGQGMVRVVCPNNERDCNNQSFKLEQGDVLVVPRFHTVAQMSFNNDTFVFAGFSVSSDTNNPQFLAGTNSILEAVNREVLALSLNVSGRTISQLLHPREEEVILDCTSCAEEEMERVREAEGSKETKEGSQETEHGGGGEEEEGYEGGGGAVPEGSPVTEHGGVVPEGSPVAEPGGGVVPEGSPVTEHGGGGAWWW